jgi:phosphate transport system protein
MSNAPHDELLAVNGELVEVARLVGAAMNLATSALLNADLGIAERVIQNDDEIDIRTSAVEERCIEIIANEAPTGRDLRIAIGALRIAASLERMGDLARHVAKQAPALPEHSRSGGARPDIRAHGAPGRGHHQQDRSRDHQPGRIPSYRHRRGGLGDGSGSP